MEKLKTKPNKNIIEIKNVTKLFGKKVALSDVSFNVQQGDCVGMIGANGAGKTTLVEMIVGLNKPTKGKINYKFDYKISPQEKIGMQFQDSSYPTGLTVKDVIQFSLDIYNASIANEELNEVLDIFQVTNFYKAKAKSLSGGQMQRLNVLLAIIHKPQILILDEISTGLDVLAREEILSYVQKYIQKGNKTLLIVSHNMDEIRRLCNRVLVFREGKLVEDRKVADIKRNLNDYIKDFLPQRGVHHE
jgi:ABC-2 type transport system ATP-binding protein